MARTKAWVNVHINSGSVRIEANMQSDLYTYRLVYSKDKGASKGMVSRRQIRVGTSISGAGLRGWDGGEVGLAMDVFEKDALPTMRKMTDAWFTDRDQWALLRTQLESDLTYGAPQ